MRNFVVSTGEVTENGLITWGVKMSDGAIYYSRIDAKPGEFLTLAKNPDIIASYKGKVLPGHKS